MSEFIELHSFQILSSGNGLFTFSLLLMVPQRMQGPLSPRFQKYPKLKSPAEIEGICPGCGAPVPCLSTACGVWRGGRCHSRDTAAVGTREEPHTELALQPSCFFHPLLLPRTENSIPAPPWGFQTVKGPFLLPQDLSTPCRCSQGLQRRSCFGGDPPPLSPWWLG